MLTTIAPNRCRPALLLLLLSAGFIPGQPMQQSNVAVIAFRGNGITTSCREHSPPSGSTHAQISYAHAGEVDDSPPSQRTA